MQSSAAVRMSPEAETPLNSASHGVSQISLSTSFASSPLPYDQSPSINLSSTRWPPSHFDGGLSYPSHHDHSITSIVPSILSIESLAQYDTKQMPGLHEQTYGCTSHELRFSENGELSFDIHPVNGSMSCHTDNNCARHPVAVLRNVQPLKADGLSTGHHNVHYANYDCNLAKYPFYQQQQNSHDYHSLNKFQQHNTLQGQAREPPSAAYHSAISYGRERSPEPRHFQKHSHLMSEYQNCLGQEKPPTLKNSCPDEERYIFNACWRHRHEETQEMWQNVQNEFESYFNKNCHKEVLRSKFERCHSEYIQWLPEDEEILQQAWAQHERTRFSTILKTFYELGGSRNMMLSHGDVEAKIVDELGLEDDLYIDVLNFSETP